jgi:type I restriction enzyme S subunit
MAGESKQLADDSLEDASQSDLFEIPPGWTWSVLGDAAGFINGDRSANYPKQADFVSHGVAFVNTGHIEPNGRLSNDRMDYISRECFERLRSGKLAKGDIVYCLRGSTIGKTARVDLSEGSVASSLVIIRAKPRVSQEYLYYFLVGPLGQSFVRQHDNGSAQPNLSVSAISRYPIPLPPLAEQKAIAAVLGGLDDKIELNRRMNATLEAMARALFQSWFVDFDPVRAKLDGRPPAALDPATAALFPQSFQETAIGHIPVGWRLSKITDCCERIHSGGTPRRDEPEYWNDATIPWLTSGEVRQPMITATENFISESGLKDSSAKWVPANSTVVALYGATAGQVSFLGSNATTNQAICSLIPKPQFAYFNYFTMRGATAEMENKAVGSAQQNISKGIIEETSFIFPSAEVLARFNLVVEPLFENWISNINQSRTLAALRDTLLPKLLSGELSVDTLFPK